MTQSARNDGIGAVDGREDSLRELVRSVARGDGHALDALVTRVYPLVRDELGRKLHGNARHELDDLTQDAIARVAAHVQHCRAETEKGVRAWVRVVAWRAALENLRTDAALVARHSQSLADHHVDHDESAGRMSVDPADDEPRGRAHGEQLARAAVEELDRLPDPVRLLFWMRLVDGASWGEIARALGSTTSAVKRRFQRAQATLRRRLGASLRRRSDSR